MSQPTWRDGRLGPLARLLDRLTPSEATLFWAFSLVVGLATGLAVLLFRQGIRWVHQGAAGGLAGWLADQHPLAVILVPALGGLVVGLLKTYLIGPERHHGVAGIMEAVALAGGRLRYARVPVKALAAALSIGFGASVGPEDPSVQIGAGMGSMFGQRLRLSDERVRLLVAAGAAAGIATAFNAPLAGVFFALEIVLLGDVSTASFGVVVLASVVAAVLTQALVGTHPAFPVPLYALNSGLELPLYFGLGLAAAGVAVVYIRALYLAQDAFHRLRLPDWLKPALVGLSLGVVGLRFPQVLGEGYETVAEVLHGEGMAFSLLLALLALKLVMTALSLGSGFVGGVFAPSLFLGAALGGAYGLLASRLFPGLDLVPSAYALVGMGAVLAGAVRAPITALLLLFELTNDYRILLPLMFAVAVSMYIAERLQPESVYTLSLVRKGLRLRRGRDVDILESLTVGEVMQQSPPVLRETDSLLAASEKMAELHSHGLPVVDERGRLVGVLSVQDIERATERGLSLDQPVGAVCTREVLVAYPDESVQAALRRMNARDVGRLPVVDRRDPQQLVGLLRRADVLRAYDLALLRRQMERYRQEQARLELLTEAEVLELEVAPGSAVEGRAMREIRWPEKALVASVLRRGHVVFPHGDTRLMAGDRLTVLVAPEAEEEVRRLVEARQPAAEAAPG